MAKLPVELRDMAGSGRRMRCEVVTTDLGIEIYVKGLGTKNMNGGAPIYVELYKGRLRVVVWADINKEDPTNVIELTEAKEKNYDR